MCGIRFWNGKEKNNSNRIKVYNNDTTMRAYVPRTNLSTTNAKTRTTYIQPGDLAGSGHLRTKLVGHMESRILFSRGIMKIVPPRSVVIVKIKQNGTFTIQIKIICAAIISKVLQFKVILEI